MNTSRYLSCLTDFGTMSSKSAAAQYALESLTEFETAYMTTITHNIEDFQSIKDSHWKVVLQERVRKLFLVFDIFSET